MRLTLADGSVLEVAAWSMTSLESPVVRAELVPTPAAVHDGDFKTASSQSATVMDHGAQRQRPS
jgi:hypothetical protein